MVCKYVCVRGTERETEIETEKREAEKRETERSGKARYGGLIRPHDCSPNLGKGQKVENWCISPSNDLS